MVRKEKRATLKIKNGNELANQKKEKEETERLMRSAPSEDDVIGAVVDVAGVQRRKYTGRSTFFYFQNTSSIETSSI